MSHTATRSPSVAHAIAVARPIPLPPPVITTASSENPHRARSIGAPYPRCPSPRDTAGRLEVSTADRGLPVPENSGGSSPSHPIPAQGTARALGGLTTRELVAARIAARPAPLVRR